MVDKKGFTLIEFMIVIAIISILGAIAAPVYVDWRESRNEDVEKVKKKSADEMKDSENRDIIRVL